MTITANATINERQISAPASPRVRALVASTFGVLPPIVLVIVGYWIVRDVNAADSGALGLIQAMPPAFYVIPVLLAASFVLQLRQTNLRTLVLSAHIIALILLFHGVVSWIEQTPRFPVTYTHIGFIEYIQRTNHTLPSLDARMSWPGFFAMGAMLDKVAGTSSAYAFTLWSPLVFNLLQAPLVFTLARAISDDKRVPWLATWLFFTVSWVGQDYFSPQAVNFLIFLAFMNIVLHFFRTDRAAFPRGLRGISTRVGSIVSWTLRTKTIRPGGSAISPTSTAQRGLLVAGLLVLYGASTVSHQLTPFFILLELIILVALRRIALRGFPLLLIVIVFAYISYGAIGFWSGHFSDIFGGVGQVGAVASQNVGSKVGGHSNHVYVIYGRLALSAAVWLTAAFGIARRLRRGMSDIFVMVGLLAPFMVLGGQSYGGEAILRVFLFSLPFAAILAVLALLPTETIKLNGLRMGLIVLSVAILGPVFTLARFGNEQFEYVSHDEYVATKKLLEIAPPGSQLVSIDSNTAWGISRSGVQNFNTATNLEPFDDPNRIYQSVATHGTRSTYLFISRTQLQDIAVTDARPSNWGQGLQQSLVDSGRFTLVYQNPDASILKVTPATLVQGTS